MCLGLFVACVAFHDCNGASDVGYKTDISQVNTRCPSTHTHTVSVNMITMKDASKNLLTVCV